MLRFDWNFLFEIINVLVLFGGLSFFLFKPVKKILQQRKEEIEKGYIEAEESKRQAEESQKKYENILADAEEEARKIVANAKAEAKEEYNQIIDDAKVQAQRIVTKAKEDMKIERENALHSLEVEMTNIVMDATKKVVLDSDTSKVDEHIFDQFILETGEANVERN